MTELNTQLITDLARLSVRYPPEDWNSLLGALDDERRREQVITLLRELAAASSARRQKRSRSERAPARAPRLRKALAAIRDADPARADLLEEVWLKLRQRELLPTMGTVRAFAQATGLKGLQSTKREQAVTELMEQIVEMPPGALDRMMRETVVEDRKLGEEYERWVRLILRQPSPSGIPADNSNT